MRAWRAAGGRFVDETNIDRQDRQDLKAFLPGVALPGHGGKLFEVGGEERVVGHVVPILAAKRSRSAVSVGVESKWFCYHSACLLEDPSSPKFREYCLQRDICLR
jgi:hypothetical protein